MGKRQTPSTYSISAASNAGDALQLVRIGSNQSCAIYVKTKRNLMTYLRADAIRQKKNTLWREMNRRRRSTLNIRRFLIAFRPIIDPDPQHVAGRIFDSFFFLNNFCIHQAAGKKQNWAVANRLEKVDKSQLHAGFFNVQYQRRKKKQKQNKGL